jgi:hypothetical protein
MTDHSHYEELAALEAGGFLSEAEHMELCEHTRTCPECLKTEEEFSEVVHSGLPLTVGPGREFADKLKTRPDNGLRSRFLHRARIEGILFSPGVDGLTRNSVRRPGFFTAAATAFAVAIIAVAFYGAYRLRGSQELMQAQQQVAGLRHENSALTASLSQLNQSVSDSQRDIQNLRAQLGSAAITAENLRRNSEQVRGEAEKSSSQNVQLLDAARNQEQLLAQARAEAARVSQLHANNNASLLQQELRIADLSNKLRVASATLDMERQLAAAGKDARELMLSRQLHVVDVHDTDSNGNPGKTFGRVFLTEGKALSFYAFDLNEDKAVNGKRNFEVWAVPQGDQNSARSLGFLSPDSKAQGRWVLKVENPELVKEISSAFVTVEVGAGGKHPSGQKMLYAYLGTANHP